MIVLPSNCTQESLSLVSAPWPLEVFKLLTGTLLPDDLMRKKIESHTYF
jgi:hypothetical protein